MQGLRNIPRITPSARSRMEAWIDRQITDRNLADFIREYWQRPVVLYTGAGVSAGPWRRTGGKQLGLPPWRDLHGQVAGLPSGDDLPDDLWRAAEKAEEACNGRDGLQSKLRSFIADLDHYREKGQLNGRLLANAPTLKAVAAFCGQPTGRVESKAKGKSPTTYFRVAANPRVHAILTSNYDCFLEAAGSNLYRTSPMKPVTALGSKAASASRVPVFHIHGYVPHPLHQDPEVEGQTDRLVLTRKEYMKQWGESAEFGYTMGPQVHLLRYYTALFVGFSFNDTYVCNLLRTLRGSYKKHGSSSHYALLRAGSVAKKPRGFFEELGVNPIDYQTHADIPSLLGQIYMAGLTGDRIMARERPVDKTCLPELRARTHEQLRHEVQYDTDQIWRIMLMLRNGGIRTSAIRDCERRVRRS